MRGEGGVKRLWEVLGRKAQIRPCAVFGRNELRVPQGKERRGQHHPQHTKGWHTQMWTMMENPYRGRRKSISTIAINTVGRKQKFV